MHTPKQDDGPTVRNDELRRRGLAGSAVQFALAPGGPRGPGEACLTRAMSTVEEWLGPGLFKALGPYLEDDLGVEEVDDVRMLEEAHLSTIRGMLKPMPLKKFNLKYAELMGEASPAASPAASSAPTLSAPGRMDYHVDGKLKVSGVNSLSMKKGVIHLDGSGVGEGMRPDQSRRITAPGKKVRDQVYARVVNLYYSGQ